MKWITAHRHWKTERWRKPIIHTPHSESLDQPALFLSFSVSFFQPFSSASQDSLKHTFHCSPQDRESADTEGLSGAPELHYTACSNILTLLLSLFLSLSRSLSLLWGFSLSLSISNTKIVKLFSNIRQFHIFLLKCS